jgi:hypothetical protein
MTVYLSLTIALVFVLSLAIAFRSKATILIRAGDKEISCKIEPVTKKDGDADNL